MGLDVTAEDVTNKGRIDLSVKIKEKIYLIEFKVVDDTNQPSKALEQIKQKKYYEKYLPIDVDIYLVGVAFEKKERNISDFQWEKLAK